MAAAPTRGVAHWRSRAETCASLGGWATMQCVLEVVTRGNGLAGALGEGETDGVRRCGKGRGAKRSHGTQPARALASRWACWGEQPSAACSWGGALLCAPSFRARWAGRGKAPFWMRGQVPPPSPPRAPSHTHTHPAPRPTTPGSLHGFPLIDRRCGSVLAGRGRPCRPVLWCCCWRRRPLQPPCIAQPEADGRSGSAAVGIVDAGR